MTDDLEATVQTGPAAATRATGNRSECEERIAVLTSRLAGLDLDAETVELLTAALAADAPT